MNNNESNKDILMLVVGLVLIWGLGVSFAAGRSLWLVKNLDAQVQQIKGKADE